MSITTSGTQRIFGKCDPARRMFDSNFPIDKLWTNYDECMAVTKTCLACLSPQDSRALFHDNAQRVYRL